MKATDIIDTEVYTIEDVDGVKTIHILGFFWKSDEYFKRTEYTWLMIPLKQFLTIEQEELDDMYCAVQQYEGDITDEKEFTDSFVNFIVGNDKVPTHLEYHEITEDTPNGLYYSKI